VSRLSAYKIWGMQFKGNIFKFEVEWRRVAFKCAFSIKNCPYRISETVSAKVAIDR